jgi:hypothetical protein
MLDNLLNLVKEFSGDAVVNNPEVPNEHNEAVMSASSNSIMNSLQGMISNGGFKDVLNLLGGRSGELSSNPVAQGLSSNLISDLMNKFNFNQGQASQVAGGLLPGVLSNLVSRTNDPSNSSFDLNGIMSALTGGKTAGVNLQSMLDRDGDGDTDMQDLMKMFSGGGQGQSAGLMDMLKGVVGN